ncbi:4-hydroxy-2-ketovalerate aldolase, partial [Fangia hongkongensis]|nr:4-hydroxy-2-ketovalerate aldolase [Fangia hongkongensis]
MSLMSILENNPVIPVVSIDTLESAYLYFDKLREKNIKIIELTLRSKNALNIVDKLI